MRTEPQAPVFERNYHKGREMLFFILNVLGKVWVRLYWVLGSFAWLGHRIYKPGRVRMGFRHRKNWKNKLCLIVDVICFQNDSFYPLDLVKFKKVGSLDCKLYWFWFFKFFYSSAKKLSISKYTNFSTSDNLQKR